MNVVECLTILCLLWLIVMVNRRVDRIARELQDIVDECECSETPTAEVADPQPRPLVTCSSCKGSLPSVDARGHCWPCQLKHRRNESAVP